MVEGIRDQADQIVYDAADVTNWGSATSPVVVVVDNDRPKNSPNTDPNATAYDGTPATIPTGYGILVIRGTAVIDGGNTWHGAVLVVGDGRLTKQGGGGGDTYGGMMVANTRWAVNNNNNTKYFGDSGTNPNTGQRLPSSQTSPGPPYFDWNGGGNANIVFDSCAVNNGTRRATYGVLAYRELTY